jgi:hypothetical protein
MSTVTLIITLAIVVLFALAMSFYGVGNRNLTRLGHALVLFGIGAIVLLVSGFFHQTWEAYVNLVWEQKL